ncbi:MAG: transcriptional regulator [Bacteroidetes bacterium]|jgi:LysR family hydrogen peroxide-inducible transcriptional activator|nr:transcriptional regulator [Bacteroidota bacterium]
MNLQQLEYIIAVDTHRHFVTAAEKSFVTQATLSMMIKKLEEELDVKIFDRSKQPVVPTEIGQKLIRQARIILSEAKMLKEIVQEDSKEIKGELRIGIIPTLAPQLLPLFLSSFLKKYPAVQLRISEITTEQIIHQLQQNTIDAGILATPLHTGDIIEEPLFYEQFVVYGSPSEKKLMSKKYLLAEDIDINKLWLLEEGHCLRSQVINLCELKKKEKAVHQLDFESGSIDTLKRMVDINEGITILPELAIHNLSTKDRKNIRYFKNPAPVREISMVSYRYFVKRNLLEVLKQEILLHIPEEVKSAKRKNVVEI